MSIRPQVFLAAIAALTVIASLNPVPLRAQTDFVTAVTSTHPLAFYRLDSTSGQSLVGATTYKVSGSASIATSGAPVTTASSRYLKLDGKTAYFTTTQMGGIGTAGSIMAWVNLADLPSKTGHFLYVAGESQNGNDFDLQFETDNVLRFYTAGGGNLSYTPSPSTLLNQWHQVVVTLDTATHIRTIYWDGKSVATDKGGGEPNKKTVFTFGASSYFADRFFKGAIDDVGLWNRALRASEVAAIYASAGASPSGAASSPATPAPAAPGSTPTTGPFATKATFDLEEVGGAKISLKREEQIAFMFLSGIEIIEHNCQLTLQKTCPLNQIIAGSYPPAGKDIEHLKFDPNKTDPNYTYTLATNGMVWEAHANPKRPGLRGWCFMARDVGTVIMTYNKTGPSGYTDTPLGNTGISGDSFAVQ
jgi:hypothetical protein